jgi:CubicO group peptidase (beta-lactamase class C family)
MEIIRKINSRTIILMQVFVICCLSCSENITTNDDIVYVYTVPSQTDDGWETASLTDVGMDETPIAQFMNEALNNLEHKIHGILIVKSGRLVFEEYFPGYAFYHGPLTEFDRETKHNLASVTKSFTSALIGLAIDNGFIQNVNQKMFSFFPEYIDLNNDEKDKITLEHLLTMTSGLEWDESTFSYSDPRNDVVQLFYQNDPIRFILNKPIVTEPGTQFLYSSGSTNVLGEIIQKTTGMRADDFAREHLFSPLGIADYQWVELSEEVLYTSGDLKMRPRDMAKLGNLYLNIGVWNGEQIISEGWIKSSTKSFIQASVDFDYGYKWWLHTFEINSKQVESFSAQGWGGQYIFVFPSLDMVVVTTAGYYDEPELEYHIDVLLMQSILSSVNNFTTN